MVVRKTFGKLGDRKRPRITVGISGEMALPHDLRSCRIEDASPGGVKLKLKYPPRLGAEVVLHFADIEAMATVIWVEEHRCALKFERQLTEDDMAILQWMAQDPEKFVRAGLGKDAAVRQ